MCVYPSLRTRASPVSLTFRGTPTAQFKTACRETAYRSLPHILTAPAGRDATANVRCYADLAEEVIVKVLSNIVARLGMCVISACVEAVANWSLDTVNTIP